MGNIFRVSYILQLISRAFKGSEIIAKYEKRGKYLPILQKQRVITTLSLNVSLNQINQELSALLIAENLLNLI